MDQICSIRKKKLRISYNDLKPYFSVENDEIITETIEGGVMKSFIDTNSLSTELIDEKYTWGSKDENEMFSIPGVIGRVT